MPDLYRGIHHLRPLKLPGLPLTVELPLAPEGNDGSARARAPPPRCSPTRGPRRPARRGSRRRRPARHAVLHRGALVAPSRSGSCAISSTSPRCRRRLPGRRRSAVAHEWGVERLWATAGSPRDCLFSGGRRQRSRCASGPRTSSGVREREEGVLENHVQRWLSDLWSLPVRAHGAGGCRRPWAASRPRRRGLVGTSSPAARSPSGTRPAAAPSTSARPASARPKRSLPGAARPPGRHRATGARAPSRRAATSWGPSTSCTGGPAPSGRRRRRAGGSSVT